MNALICNRRAPRGVRRPARGFTLVEILIAVAIMSALLMATAMAISSSVGAFEANQAATEVLQRSRLAVTRIADEVRTGTGHLPLTPGKQTSFSAGTTVSDTGLSFVDTAGRLVTYAFQPADGTVTMKVDARAPSVLVRGVDAFTVRMVPSRSPESIKTGGLYDELGRATVTITLHPTTDELESHAGLTLTQSVTPRARLWE